MKHEAVDKYYDPTYKDMQSVKDYENSHTVRIIHLISDLEVDKLQDKMIVDVGCGSGLFFKHLPDNNNYYLGLDGSDITEVWEGEAYDKKHLVFERADFDFPFSNMAMQVMKREFGKDKADCTFCLETLEHIPNVYNLVKCLKEITKENGTIVISIPAEDCTHNTLYPALLWPRQNFMEFLDQMAMEIVDVRRHDKAFSQDVYILKNRSWNFSKMKFYKHEEKFRGIEPLVAVNL